MKRLFTAISILGFVSVLACGSQNVKQDYVPEVDFDQFKTYDWLEPAQPVKQLMKEYPALDEVVTSAVNRLLRDKGFRETTGNVDFLLDYDVIIEEAADVRTWGTRYGKPSKSKIETYEKGTLIVDVLEPESMELIWRGSAEEAVVEDRTEEQTRKAIDEIVHKILKDFPPQ